MFCLFLSKKFVDPSPEPGRIPIFREYLLGLGVNSVSKESIGGNFRRGPGASATRRFGGLDMGATIMAGQPTPIMGEQLWLITPY